MTMSSLTCVYFPKKNSIWSTMTHTCRSPTNISFIKYSTFALYHSFDNRGSPSFVPSWTCFGCDYLKWSHPNSKRRPFFRIPAALQSGQDSGYENISWKSGRAITPTSFAMMAVALLHRFWMISADLPNWSLACEPPQRSWVSFGSWLKRWVGVEEHMAAAASKLIYPRASCLFPIVKYVKLIGWTIINDYQCLPIQPESWVADNGIRIKITKFL